MAKYKGRMKATRAKAKEIMSRPDPATENMKMFLLFGAIAIFIFSRVLLCALGAIL